MNLFFLIPAMISFQGAWHINSDKSVDAGGAAPQIQITQTADSIFIDRTTDDKQSFSEHLSFDGKTFISYTTSKRRKSGTAKWDNDDKTSFTENAILGNPQNQDEVAFKVTEQWSLSADGNTLTEKATLTRTGGQSFSYTAVYDKGTK